MKKLAILAAFIFCPFAIQAQEVFINADLVSSYIWRGMKNGNASVQPTLGVEWKDGPYRHGDRQNSETRIMK